jgi:biotin operon repressor
MAVNKSRTDTKLMVRVKNGTSTSGAEVTKNLSYSQVKVNASDDELFAAGTAIADLQSKILNGIRIVETYDVTG